ncbi:hypothetical protein [Thorsellia kenyensis]|uniref:AsmA-like C-terminal domain-containing protein n=1 Tax=Thorsellia kenyensis TaxID=1549888 RepID=A0ABV6C9L6_9GAMM
MKRAIRITFTLISLVLSGILLIYFLPQSQQVAPWFAKFLSKHNELTINFSHIEHSLSQANTITIHNLAIKSADDENILTAQKMIVSFNSLTDFFTLPTQEFLNLKYLYIENGHINLSKLPSQRVIHIKELQLKNVKYETVINSFKTQFIGLSGKFSDWINNRADWYDKTSEFNLYAVKVVFSRIDDLSKIPSDTNNNLLPSLNSTHALNTIFGDRFNVSNLTLKGRILDKVLFLDILGFDWLDGAISTNGRFSNDLWRIDTLFIDNIQRDFNIDIDMSRLDLLNKKIQIKELTIINSTLSGINWALEDLYFKAKNIDLSNGKITKLNDNTESLIESTANRLLFDDLILNQLNISTEIKKNKWLLNTISTSLLNGFISFSGVIDLQSKHLAIDKMVANDFSFTIQTLPNSLGTLLNFLNPLNDLSIQILQVKNFSLQSTSSKLPWQFRNLTLEGKNIKLKEKSVYQLFNGIFNGSMDRFSIKKIDMNKGLSFTLLSDRQQFYFSNIHSANSNGYINIPKLSISKTSPAKIDLSFLAQGIDSDIFTHWHIPSFNIDSKVSGKTIDIHAHVRGVIPGSSTVNSLLNKTTEILPNFDLPKYLGLSGEIEASNSADFGVNNQRFNIIQQYVDGNIISRSEEHLPSLKSLGDEVKKVPQKEMMHPEKILEISTKAHQEVDFIFELYQSIFSNAIDLKINKLKTAPFFDNIPQDVNEIETIPSE